MQGFATRQMRRSTAKVMGQLGLVGHAEAIDHVYRMIWGDESAARDMDRTRARERVEAVLASEDSDLVMDLRRLNGNPENPLLVSSIVVVVVVRVLDAFFESKCCWTARSAEQFLGRSASLGLAEVWRQLARTPPRRRWWWDALHAGSDQLPRYARAGRDRHGHDAPPGAEQAHSV